MNGTGNESKPTVHWTRYAVGVLATLAGLLLVWYFRDIVGYIIVSAVLAIIGTPLAKLMKRVRVRGRSVPDWLAALVVLLLLWGVGVAMFAIFIPLVFDKLTALASVDFSTILASFEQPLHKLQNFLEEYFSLNVSTISISDTIGAQVERLFNPEKLQNFLGSIVSGVANAVIALFSITFITFFFLKDGQRFLPLVRRVTGRRVGWHLTEILTRCWKTLGGFIRTQAIVSFIDAFFIGLGLFAIGVPLAGPLAIITFFGGFIPIVGAFSAGALSVLVALVANGFSSALAVLVLIIAVQQLEGNILSPMLQSKAMNMHAAVVLLSVTVGGGLFGLLGAFVAVPAAAMITEVVRYLGDLGDIATGEKGVDEIEFATIMTHKKQERLEAEAAKKHGFVTGILSRLKKKNDDAA